MYKILITFIVFFTFITRAFAQDTLPRLSVKKVNNQVIISWKNNYGAKISTINIQRSKDSLKNFVTIGSVLNPLSRENGYVDRKAHMEGMFYRLFVAFEGGNYIFSESHHPFIDTSYRGVVKQEIGEPMTNEPESIEASKADPFITLPSIVLAEPVLEESFDNFLPKVKIPKVVVPTGFVPSKYIFTNKENNLVLNLPDAEILKFSIKFFDDKNVQVLEIKKITENYLLVEKVNFLHSGWFYYQLFEDGIFLERFKFYIAKEAKFPVSQISKPGR